MKPYILGIPDFDSPVSGSSINQAISSPLDTTDRVGVIRQAELTSERRRRRNKQTILNRRSMPYTFVSAFHTRTVPSFDELANLVHFGFLFQERRTGR